MSNLELFLSVLVTSLLGALIWALNRLMKTRILLAEADAHKTTDHLMLDRFRSLATQVFEGQSQQFLQLAQSTLANETLSHSNQIEKQKIEISHLVDPLKIKLEEYQKNVLQIERDRQRAFAQVESELKRVAEVSQSLGHETTALKNALKKPHIRGRWGEVQLKNCVDIAGMSEYSDIQMQSSSDVADGGRLIPDMIVRMPGDRVVVVDAKTPLDAFISSLEANDDETRAIELTRHGRHIKEHIKKLSQKEYQQNVKNSADFTILFLPNESFLYAALETEPDIMEFAIQKKILIATPPTLIGLLKVIRYGWNEQRLAENAQKISELGIELHKRIADFTDSYQTIGTLIEKVRKEYDAGLGRLQSRVLVQAKRLENFGAKSNKELLLIEEINSESAMEGPDTKSPNEIA